MTVFSVAIRATRHHWRTHLPAMAFIGLATAIVTGAMEVQTSIRSYLFEALVSPLGHVNSALVANGTFRSDLAGSMEAAALTLNSTASNSESSDSTPATLWGLGPDAKPMWFGFQPPSPGKAMVSATLGKSLNLNIGSRLFLRIPTPNAAPLASVFGRRLAAQSTKEVSLEVIGFLPPNCVGDFSLIPKIGDKSLVVVNRDWLCGQLNLRSQSNVILFSEPTNAERLTARLTLEDHGLTLSKRAQEITIRSSRVVLTSKQVAACELAAKQCGVDAKRSLVALALDVRCGSRHISYAMVDGRGDNQSSPSKIQLNDWAANQLRASPGDRIDVSLLVPRADGTYGSRVVTGFLSSILPMAGEGANPDLVPMLPGMTDTVKVSDWSTPFPVDLSLITDGDEAYWSRFHAASKVFVDVSATHLAWGAGKPVTSITVSGSGVGQFPSALLCALKPEDSGLSIIHARANAIRASRGSSDLAGLILGLSLFLILSALGLAGSLLVLNFQSRSRDLRLMTYVGLPSRTLFFLLVCEASLVSIVGSLMGTPGGAILAKSSLILLSQWTAIPSSIGHIAIVVSPKDLILGVISGVICALASVLIYARPLLAARRIRRPHGLKPFKRPLQSDIGLLLRSIRQRPMRLLSVAMVVGAGTAVLGIAAGSFSTADSSSTGGLALQVETTLPVAIDWTSPEGRKRLHFDPSDEAVFQGVSAFTLLRSPGTDVSCLNPAKPIAPRLAAVDSNFIHSAPFLATDNRGQNAWHQLAPSESVSFSKSTPAIGDSDTLEWILGSGVGQRFDLQLPNGGRANLNFVGATHGTFLAGDLLVSQAQFHTLFPEVEAPTLFLVKVPLAKERTLESALIRNLSDYGVTVRRTSDIVRSLRGVFNAYISIFLVFGVMGLVLGVCGTSVSAARNALDRRAEFALMLAVGISRSRVRYWMVAETHMGVLCGTAVGLLLSVSVALSERASVSLFGVVLAALSIMLTSTLSCLAVSHIMLSKAILGALRSE